MAQGDDRFIPKVPNNLNEVADLLRDIWEVLHALEGRVGPISLRDNLSVMGGITATGDLETNVTTDGSVELDNYLQINERIFDAAGVLTPTVAPVGSSRIYQDPISDTLKVSQNGAAYVDLVSSTPTGTTQMCRVFNSGNISIPDATLTPLTFDSEDFDTDSMHDLAVNTGRITFNTAGKYLVGASIRFAPNTGTTRQVRIRLNGVTQIAINMGNADAVTSNNYAYTPNALYDFSIGDYIEVTVFQVSGGALNVEASSKESPIFWAVRQPTSYVL